MAHMSTHIIRAALPGEPTISGEVGIESRRMLSNLAEAFVYALEFDHAFGF